ncbi:hypothetical protein GIJ44_20905 [Staphylococcus sp. KY49P]|nr:hypothetical protein [Staphylococcus sp. KY49P]
MARIPYQLLKNDEPIALGSMTHCLDVFYWEIYYGCDHLAYNIVPFKQNDEVYRKAKAWNNYLISVEEDAKNEFGDNEDLVKHAVELTKKIFMEDE